MKSTASHRNPHPRPFGSFLALGMLLIWLALPHPAHANFLFNQYLTPGFDGQPETQFSRWDIFYSPNGGANFPDSFAPFGTQQTASEAGFTPPSDANPSDPVAFWNSSNPTLTQTNGGHFIIGPGSAGNIYSFAVPSFYELNNSTPYALGTVVFQYQTEGTATDFSSIRLVYDDNGQEVELAPDEMIREFASGVSPAFPGERNRTALQWDLSGLDISQYQIRFNSTGSSMSFQQALLDTSATFQAVVPIAGTWTAPSGDWSDSANWAGNQISETQGNVRFDTSGPASINLNSDRNVGEIMFGNSADTTISGPGTVNVFTGVSTSAGSNGTYVIESDYFMGALNLMEIRGGEVRLDGVVSGNQSLIKSGDGTLVLGNDNSFTGGVAVRGGTLRVEGSNSYSGSTTVGVGRLEIAANAPAGANGALGNATTPVTLGFSDTLFSGITTPAELVIDGDFVVGRNINIEQGAFEKRIGGRNSPGGAEISGIIDLRGSGSGASGLELFAQNHSDILRVSGGLTGGSTSGGVLVINANGQGTVLFSGSNKAYSSHTEVAGGTLRIENGTSTTGNGDWTVQTGATLHLDGTLGGNGSFTMEPGSIVTGSGTLARAFTVGSGVTLAPGNSPGTLNTASQTWAGGGIYLWEINDVEGSQGTDPGWDLLNIAGTLSITATALDPFIIEITSLTLANTAGAAANFDDFTDYSWLIASATDGISGFDPDVFIIDPSGFQNSFTGTFGLGVDGNDLFLHYVAIPEPSSLFLLSVALLACLAKRRRRFIN